MDISRGCWTSVAAIAFALAGCETTRGPGYDKAKLDPWSRSTSGAEPVGGDSEGGGLSDLGGPEQILKTIAENVKKPGPYEAPEHSASFDKTRPHHGVIDLSGAVLEREAYSLSLFGGGMKGMELRELMQHLEKLAADAQLKGLVLNFEDLEISLPDAIELRGAMRAFRSKGKTLSCFAESAEGVTYLVMTGCDSIGLAPLGMILLSGPAAMPIHIKPLLDSLAIKADFLHIGDYKGAAEPLTRDAPSPQMLEVLNQILDRRYQTMIDMVAEGRKLDATKVKAVIDEAMFAPEAARSAQLVDEVATWEEYRTKVAGDAWTELKLDDEPDEGGPGLVKVMQFLGVVPPPRPTEPHVAVVYALGNVVDGQGSGVLGARSEIASGTLVAALRALAGSDDVKAVVIRIDSGGGSALASELIWHAVNQLKAKKPVVVSMSDVAASGGYYIAAGATKIYALDDTLTGSIGVVGGKLALAGGLDKIGVKTFPMGRGKRATMFASLGAWNDDERETMRKWMAQTYEVFVGRVAQGRHKTPDQIKPIAQGRVWTGTKAKELGLVDEIGGLDAAIADARKLGGVGPTTDVEVYPPQPTLRDFVRGIGGVSSPLGLSAPIEASLGALPPHVRAQVRQLFGDLLTFSATPVQTRAFVPAIE